MPTNDIFICISLKPHIFSDNNFCSFIKKFIDLCHFKKRFLLDDFDLMVVVVLGKNKYSTLFMGWGGGW